MNTTKKAAPSGQTDGSSKSMTLEMKQRGYKSESHPSTRRKGFIDIVLICDLPESFRKVS